jgi:hypothetical protein
LQLIVSERPCLTVVCATEQANGREVVNEVEVLLTRQRSVPPPVIVTAVLD